MGGWDGDDADVFPDGSDHPKLHLEAIRQNLLALLTALDLQIGIETVPTNALEVARAAALRALELTERLKSLTY